MIETGNATPAYRIGSTVLGTFIDALDWKSVITRIVDWAFMCQPRIVCLCNVHSSVTAMKNQELTAALNSSDMVLPDGAPVAWMLRHKGFSQQTRISGPDLMIAICGALAEAELSVFLFGSRQETLDLLQKNLRNKFPTLRVVGTLSPKYGEWSEDEQTSYIDTINKSRARVIFVGLGCPKQEIWMAAKRAYVNGVMLGVGAAFDFHAGTIKRAPKLLQRLGLEWLHRLLSEPRRLWRRYITTNSIFLCRAVLDIINGK